jgi:predicted alpha-1,2-mannosidase
VKILKDTSRRRFLKNAGVGVVLVALNGSLEKTAIGQESSKKQGKALASMHANPETKSQTDKLELVNLLQGTHSSRLFSRGNTLPIVAMPFGMEHWTLQTNASAEPWFFSADDARVEGFRCTHQLSPWLSDYGCATFLPFCGNPSPVPAQRASSYRQDQTILSPSYLCLNLLRYRCRTEMVPTERGAILRICFEESGAAGLMVDLPGEDAEFADLRENKIVAGLTHANNGGVPAGFTAYYVMEVNTPITGFDVKILNGRRVGVIHFQAKKDIPVECRIAGSFISREQAMTTLHRELGGKSFQRLRAAAEKAWETELSRIEIAGGTEEQRRIFYSCLYRVALFPRIFHEFDSSENAVHYSAYRGGVRPGVMYADHGYWDLYRAWYPLMSIINPERLGEILQGWVNASKEGGWLPQFPAPGYRSCMTGSLIDSVFGDAAAKGIGGYDVEAAFAALRKHATQPGNPDSGYGRRGIEDYLKQGYVSADHVAQAAVETLDSAYGDFCIAQVARALRKDNEATLFEKRARNWKNVFDPETRFMRGKSSDGKWIEPFDPVSWGGAYVEGAAWQHRFSVPHDVGGLIEAMGGRAAFVSCLENMLHMEPRFDVGTYGTEIHEMSEMAAVDFGQYAHNNQPVHHILYLFAAAGRRDLTQFWVRRVLDTLYTSKNFPGDEDTGSMAAWYVLSALGFYPVCPGKPEYVLGAPLFDQATIRVENSRTTTIRALNNHKERLYCGAPRINGKPHNEVAVPHRTIVEGSEIVFEMAAKAQG